MLKIISGRLLHEFIRTFLDTRRIQQKSKPKQEENEAKLLILNQTAPSRCATGTRYWYRTVLQGEVVVKEQEVLYVGRVPGCQNVSVRLLMSTGIRRLDVV